MKKRIEEFKNKIIHGDCIDSLKLIPDESVDVIFADPPYWMQTEGVLLRTNGSKFAGVEDEWDKFGSFDEYDNFSIAWLKECYRIIKPNGSIWVIGSFQNIYRLGYIMQNLGFWILNDIVWAKPNAVPNFGGTRFQNAHETLLWCSKGQKSRFVFNYKTMKFLNGGKQAKSVWDIGICIGNERLKDSDGKKIHATQKPEKLLYNIIISSTRPGDIVLDPFFGTGTTGAIAKRYGRNYIGIEREEKYIFAAEERLNSVKNQSDEITNLSLEVKPPRVSLSELISKKYLCEGQLLFNKGGCEICRIRLDGKVDDGEEKLSIHKMSAKHLGVLNSNGWNYFYFKDGDDRLRSIDELRYLYQEEFADGVDQ